MPVRKELIDDAQTAILEVISDTNDNFNKFLEGFSPSRIALNIFSETSDTPSEDPFRDAYEICTRLDAAKEELAKSPAFAFGVLCAILEHTGQITRGRSLDD